MNNFYSRMCTNVVSSTIRSVVDEKLTEDEKRNVSDVNRIAVNGGYATVDFAVRDPNDDSKWIYMNTYLNVDELVVNLRYKKDFNSRSRCYVCEVPYVGYTEKHLEKVRMVANRFVNRVKELAG